MKWILFLYFLWGSLASLSYKYVGQRGRQAVSLSCDGAVSRLSLPSFGDAADVSEVQVEYSREIPNVFLKASETAMMLYSRDGMSMGMVRSGGTESSSGWPLITKVRIIEMQPGTVLDNCSPVFDLDWDPMGQSPDPAIDIVDVTVRRRGGDRSFEAGQGDSLSTPAPDLCSANHPSKQRKVHHDSTLHGKDDQGDSSDTGTRKASSTSAGAAKTSMKLKQGDCVRSLDFNRPGLFMVHSLFSKNRLIVQNPRNDTRTTFVRHKLIKCTLEEVRQYYEQLEAATNKPLPKGSFVTIQGMKGDFIVTGRHIYYSVQSILSGEVFEVVERQSMSPAPVLPSTASTFETVSTQSDIMSTNDPQVLASMASSALEQGENTQSHMGTAAKGAKPKPIKQYRSQFYRNLQNNKEASSALAFPKDSWVMRNLSDGTQMGPYRVHGFDQNKYVVIDPENDHSLKFDESDLVQCGATFQPPVPKVEPIPDDAKVQIKGSSAKYRVSGRCQSGAYRLCPDLGKNIIRRLREVIIYPISLDP